MLILRSTIPPKTLEDVVRPFLEARSSLRCGEDFGLAVCPERILEGRAIRELFELPEIVGGINEASTLIAKEIFLAINPDKEILTASPTGAETGQTIHQHLPVTPRLHCPTSSQYGRRCMTLMRQRSSRSQTTTMIGATSRCPVSPGGPCLSKDGTFLDQNTTFTSIVSAAWKLNESIPQHIANSIKKVEGILFSKRIAVLGLSFKAGSDDLRNSPSAKLIEILKSTGADVLIHDPYVKSTEPLESVLRNPDIVIIATNHKEFKGIKDEIAGSNARIIYDVWSMYDRADFPNRTYLRFGEAFQTG